MIYLYLLTIIAAFLFLYLWLTGDSRLRRRIEITPFPEAWKGILHKYVLFYNNLSDERKPVFEKRLQLFLAKKRITGISIEVNDDDRILVAASAVIPIFGFPEWEYSNLDEVLLYPASFDENYRSGNNGTIAGMAGAGGWSNTMILSRPDLYAGFQKSNDGSNVGIHEFIHYIDMADGEVDGIPSLLLEQQFTLPWISRIKKEIDNIHKGKSDINPYGGSSDIEFFAVVSEYFFEKPGKLKIEHPELFDLLNKMFRQDVVSLLKNSILKRGKKKKPGRNDPCPCGSGKKYKKCCLS